ncbi:hypothetical protein pdam_00008311, partial [Pocillopora damicornis]
LQLLNASAPDDGIYWCGSVSGNKSQEVNISVTVAASFVTIEPGSPDNSYFVLRGSVFLLNCTVRSGFGQTPNVSWKHNDKWLFDRMSGYCGHLPAILKLKAEIFGINICFWATELDIDLSYSITIPAR